MVDTASFRLSLIIPAKNEARHIGNCLEAVLAQTGITHGELEVIVVANGCSDDTHDLARQSEPAFAQKGWPLRVIDIPTSGKVNALNVGCGLASSRTQAFLDADVTIDASLLAEVIEALQTAAPKYATGALRVAPAKNWVSRRYGALWAKLPYLRPGRAAGAGFFAVNAAGRSRWDRFPNIIADDLFVRCLFRPEERIEVQSGYNWPLVEGFTQLVRVRRRQDTGNSELHRRYPHLKVNDDKEHFGAYDCFLLALANPVDFAVYAGVKAAVRLRPQKRTGWARGAR